MFTFRIQCLHSDISNNIGVINENTDLEKCLLRGYKLSYVFSTLTKKGMKFMQHKYTGFPF